MIDDLNATLKAGHALDLGVATVWQLLEGELVALDLSESRVILRITVGQTTIYQIASDDVGAAGILDWDAVARTAAINLPKAVTDLLQVGPNELVLTIEWPTSPPTPVFAGGGVLFKTL